MRGNRARQAVASWSGDLAVVLALVGVARLIAWANRWYVTTRFADGAGAADGLAWHGVYERMASAHEALLSGVVLLMLAALLTAAGRRARRAPARG